MFNLKNPKKMNQKTEKMLTAEMSTRTRIVSYAPVASTRGDKVKIYRYGFERIGSEYRHQLEAEQHPMRKAVIRYKWARFILNHLDEYSGDKALFRRSAELLATTAYLEAKQLRTEVERNIKDTLDNLRRQEKRLGIMRDTNTTQNVISASEKSKLEHLRYNLKFYRKRQNELLAICSDNLFDNIRRLADNFN